jgi:Family of unknown function (DUF6412)
MRPSPRAELAQLVAYACGLGLALASPRDLLALTALALVGMAVALLAHRAGVAVLAGPLSGRAVALREKAWSAAFQRQRDPDAAGRPRPRAPGLAVPAAA